MAADQTAKRQNDATRMVAAIDKLMAGFEEAAALDTKMTKAGETHIDADFVGALAHLDAVTFAAARTKLATIATWMNVNRDAFDKIRP